MTSRRRLDLSMFAAPLFVPLWSTGFVGAKYGLPYADPLTFLAWRFALVSALLAGWVILVRAPWPRRAQLGDLALGGLLMHVGYLGGVFTAIHLGVRAGVVALIIGLQPILVTILAWPLLGERVRPAQWLGLALGLAGVALVVLRKLDANIGDWRGVALCGAALVSISLGVIHQKRRCADAPMRSGSLVQFIVAGFVTLGLAALFETGQVRWTGEFIFALVWLSGALSVGAISLLHLLIKRGAAAKVASLFFLVPPVTALFSWAAFGETFGPLELTGMAVAAIGVALVNAQKTRQSFSAEM